MGVTISHVFLLASRYDNARSFAFFRVLKRHCVFGRGDIVMHREIYRIHLRAALAGEHRWTRFACGSSDASAWKPHRLSDREGEVRCAALVVEHKVGAGAGKDDEPEPVERVAEQSEVKSSVRNLRERNMRVDAAHIDEGRTGARATKTRDGKNIARRAIWPHRERTIGSDNSDPIRDPRASRALARPAQECRLPVLDEARRRSNDAVEIGHGYRRRKRLRKDVLHRVLQRCLRNRR